MALIPLVDATSTGTCSRRRLVRYGRARTLDDLSETRHCASRSEPQIIAPGSRAACPEAANTTHYWWPTRGQSWWPPVGKLLAACGQFLMAADNCPQPGVIPVRGDDHHRPQETDEPEKQGTPTITSWWDLGFVPNPLPNSPQKISTGLSTPTCADPTL